METQTQQHLLIMSHFGMAAYPTIIWMGHETKLARIWERAADSAIGTIIEIVGLYDSEKEAKAAEKAACGDEGTPVSRELDAAHRAEKAAFWAERNARFPQLARA